MATTKVIITGPLFDGSAAAAAAEFTTQIAAELAVVGRDWIRLDTQRMDKSGRGGTGAAAGGVELIGLGPSWVIRGGIREGQYAWPWLEGTSKRNASTGFRGYGSFRRTRLRLRTQARPLIDQRLGEFTARLGGGEA